MIRSMTGFGRSIFESDEITMTVEVRSLNSKNLELNLRLPYSYRSLEDELRSIIKPQLLRGKVDVSLSVKQQGSKAAAELNKDVISAYMNQLGEIADATPAELLTISTRLPDAIQSPEVLPDEAQKKEVFSLVRQAAEQLINYQKTEGQAMVKDLTTQIESIQKGLDKVNRKKDERTQQTRSKLLEQLKGLAVEIDQNRLEQELIYYLEKLDINEEIVRLRQHLSYFSDVMKSDTVTKGKKLGFVSQEIGREINTIGSKANNASLQKEIVQMKDALERIKEQLLNII
ncbi:MAG: YicC family protein [Flavobacteriales bacterium]|nr:YicC family protein [Flavobacteriales bacterium]MED5362733.1 YicC/YloC family endoribonuclease [Bacteroidota bacterium]